VKRNTITYSMKFEDITCFKLEITSKNQVLLLKKSSTWSIEPLS